MHSRFMTITAVALLASAGATAQPVKTPTPAPRTPLDRPTPLVLASADRIAPGPAQVANAAQVKRPRAARVTSCRCGGGEPQPEQQEEQ